tara:strand:- start:126 stop:497 length:372 start_codon:yes stop_codon:yes gene_type:complete
MKKIFVIIFLLISTKAFSLEYKSNFTIVAFEQAQNSGKIVVVNSWNKFCGTCKKQKTILKQAEKEFNDVLFMYFEHNKNKDIAKYLDFQFWSTIAVYKNNNQVEKVIGLNTKENIYNLIKKGI